MEEFSLDQLPLGEGLNLYDPQSLTKAGFLSECQNFEIVSAYSGVVLVGGYEPFVGNSQPFQRYSWVYAAQVTATPLFTTPLGNSLVPYANWDNTVSYMGGPVYTGDALITPYNVGGLFMGSFRRTGSPAATYTRMQMYDRDILDNTTTNFFGATAASVNHALVLEVKSSTLNDDNFPFEDSSAYAGVTAPFVIPAPATTFTTKEAVAGLLLDHAKAAFHSVSNYAGELPQEALGLYWFQDHLFAVAPHQFLRTALIAPATNLNVEPGDYIKFTLATPSGWVHRYAEGSGAAQTLRATGGQALTFRVIDVDSNNEYILVAPQETMLVESSSATKAHPYYYSPTVRNFQVPPGYSQTGVDVMSAYGVFKADANFNISGSAPAGFKDEVKCGIFMARSIEQSIVDGGVLTKTGWSPITQTWTVLANNGFAADGELVKYKTGVDAADQQTSEAAGATTGAAGTNADPDHVNNKGNPAVITTGHASLPVAIQFDDPSSSSQGSLSNYRNLSSSSNSSWASVPPLGVEGSPPFQFPAAYVDDYTATGDWVGLPAIRSCALTTASPTCQLRSGVLNFTGFGDLDNEIPATASIRGVVLEVRYSLHKAGIGFGYGITDNLTAGNAETLNISLTGNLSRVSSDVPAPYERADLLLSDSRSATIVSGIETGHAAYPITGTATLGSSTDTWGAASIKREDVIRALQGVSLQLSGAITLNAADASATVVCARMFKIHEVVMRVHYVLPSVRYYFHNGVDANQPENFVKGDLIDYTVLSGDLASGDATLVMQFTNVLPMIDTGGAPDYGLRNFVADGDNITTSANTSGTLVGKATANMTPILLPSASELEAEESKYQFIDANFYGDTAEPVIYGVSGAGRGFAFDQNHLQLIYANINDESLDKPRHVAEYEGQLCLATKSGALYFSDVGAPTSYTGFAGAALVTVGQRITGLSQLVGNTLGVFCDNSVRTISGATPDYLMKTLSPTGGCIEYTIVDIGSPVYCSQAGITTLDQTEKYGDFYGSTLSEAVNSWLLPRLTTKAAASSGSSANSRQIIAAVPVRKNAQYKLFFEDGQVLTMTFVGQEKSPKFTMQKYFINQQLLVAADEAIVPRAFSSQIDSSGKERVHISYRSKAADSFYLITGAGVPMYGHARGIYDVVELNVGWTFYFEPIYDAYFVVSANYMNNPFEYGSLRKVRLEGRHQGYDNLLAYAFSDYRTYAEYTSSPELQDISLFEETRRGISEDYLNGGKITNLPSHGRFFKIAVVANSEEELGASLTPSLGVVAQSLNVQYEKGKPDA